MSNIRVVIIEDNAIVAESLAQFLGEAKHIEIAFSARSFEDFEEAHLAKNSFDIVLLDINLPGMNAIQAIQIGRAHV